MWTNYEETCVNVSYGLGMTEKFRIMLGQAFFSILTILVQDHQAKALVTGGAITLADFDETA